MNTVPTLIDLSGRARFGCKGRGAEQWLAARDLAPPAAPNSWKLNAQGAVIARLGTEEFLIEGCYGGEEHVRSSGEELMSLSTVDTGTYWVPRQDRVFGLSGDAVCELLLECCSYNFRALAPAVSRSSGPLVLTSMIGVAVLIVAEPADNESARENSLRFTIWCDPSFASYLSSTLLELINESSTHAAVDQGKR